MSKQQRNSLASANQVHQSALAPEFQGRLKHAEDRYREVATAASEEDQEAMDFFSHHATSRAPYDPGKHMCRGAAYYPKFKEYLEKGGLARFKNSVVASIRINTCHTLDEMVGSFAVSYYLDLAFWVPLYHEEFYHDDSTVGQFARFEPNLFFPDTKSSMIVGRSHEFSKAPRGRQHEIQLGMHKEKSVKLHEGHWAPLKHRKVNSSLMTKASDPQAHWPRMWRALCSDEEVSYLEHHHHHSHLPIHSSRYKEKGLVWAKELREKLELIDNKRRFFLNQTKDEGILFVTHEVEGVCLEHFELEEFPYDTQSLSIKVRIEKGHDDPLNRYLVPLCIDKAFFCTSRVAPLVEWTITKNLDWEVTTGAGGEQSRDGGKQRLIARVLACRKSYYYTLHYVLMAFSISTISFAAFTIDPINIETRSNIVLTVLLTVVAFNYVCQDKIPKVPYATILDTFLICNHITILLVGFVIMIVSYIANEGSRYFQFWGFKPDNEPIVGAVMFACWILGNIAFGVNTLVNVRTVRHHLIESERLEFLDFSGEIKNSRIRSIKGQYLILDWIRKVATTICTCMWNMLSVTRMRKMEVNRRKALHKKFLKKLEVRGFEVCGGDSNGLLLYGEADINNNNEGSHITKTTMTSPITPNDDGHKMTLGSSF